MDFRHVLNQYQNLLYYSGIQYQMNNVPQLLILYLHSINLAYGLKCTGINENDPESDYIIPPNWNIPDENNMYSLRYKDPRTNELFYFKFLEDKSKFNVNVTRSHNKEVKYNSAFDLSQGQNILTYLSLRNIFVLYQRDILNHINDVQNYGIMTEFLIKNDNVAKEDSQSNSNFRFPKHLFSTEFPNPFGKYGSSDLEPVPLDPYGQKPNGQGNLVGPDNPIFNQGPRRDEAENNGYIKPPGARFDPYGPDGITPFDEPKPLEPRGPPPKNPDVPFGSEDGFLFELP